jgi:F-type H+-transporting ATPase subunit gamma
MFYTSLMAEHYRRVQHLEGAIDRLEQRAEELGKKRNMLRQEEITEEIEVIMLSAGIIH